MSETASKKTVAERKPWQRALLGVIRWTWLPLACVAAVIIGMVVGYVYLGKQEPGEMLDMGTWRHLFDLIFADN
ncbi:DNA-directed RNA polymerase subunit beta [Paenibacillus silviterrae]|uniref:DNA-directed RNA polymerase subunit beta n=1 Tax=Paenibacillus silviterrae TaxID=3242194 RepID=UPI00254334F7|nr:DNA-directed RNA polymerase subunit beta [Paenibacillus chinjuensis]